MTNKSQQDSTRQNQESEDSERDSGQLGGQSSPQQDYTNPSESGKESGMQEEDQFGMGEDSSN